MSGNNGLLMPDQGTEVKLTFFQDGQSVTAKGKTVSSDQLIDLINRGEVTAASAYTVALIDDTDPPGATHND